MLVLFKIIHDGRVVLEDHFDIDYVDGLGDRVSIILRSQVINASARLYRFHGVVGLYRDSDDDANRLDLYDRCYIAFYVVGPCPVHNSFHYRGFARFRSGPCGKFQDYLDGSNDQEDENNCQEGALSTTGCIPWVMLQLY